MRIVLCTLLLVSGVARAGTPVVVDREAIQGQIHQLSEQLRQLQMQLDQLQRQLASAQPAGPPPRNWTPPPPPRREPMPIDDATLSSLVDSINAQGFGEDKLRVLGQASQSQFYLVAQAQRILGLFPFDKDKLRALELVAPRLLDRQRSFQLIDSFPFSESKARAQQILSR
jgi:type II secretory pathway pseudopilin PulG